jgi:flagellar biosynthesis/type III secretory pathway protein FliH
MTSSYRATSTASVRQTPAAAIPSAGVWSLSELTVPTRSTPSSPAPNVAPPAVDPQLLAEERARLIDEGYARGLADGERKASLAAQQRITDAAGVVDAVVVQMREIASLSPSILEENVAALAVIVARQIVAREVSLDRELVADLVRRALTEFPIDQSVRIRVNPLDLALLTFTPDGAPGMAPITANRDASWLADPRVARGGCLVEGRDRIVDGRVDTALERAYRRMAEIDAS